MDQCEELAAAWGVLPQAVFLMPSVHVRILWDTYVKRKQRDMKWQAMLAGASFGTKMTGGFGGADPDAGASDADIEQFAGGSFPVRYH